MNYQLTQALHRAMRHRPNDIAYVDDRGRRTWAEFGNRAARLAAALAALGTQKGQRIGILALNGGVYLETMMGVWWLGAAINPVNIRWTAAEIAYSLDDCDTSILLIDDSFAPLAAELRARSQALATLIYTGPGPAPGGMLSYETLIAETAPIADSETGGESLAGVFYTGGTTGHPKGVMLTHNGLLSNTIGALLEVPFSEDDVVMIAAPLFHLAGACIFLRAQLRGCRILLLPGFNAPAAMRAIETERVSFTLLVPTMIQMLVDHQELPNHDLSSLRRIMYGASPIGEGLLVRAMARLPAASFIQSYGLTETSGPFTILPAIYHTPEGRTPDRLRAAGRPFWSMEMRIVDPHGDPVPTGQVGEIAVRGPGVTPGYWNKPDQTAAALRHGWLHSGDAGYMDDEGFLFIVDRVKDMIVSGGENVYSTEVESAISKHDAVAACAVFGIPSERWGEAVHAVVVLKDGAETTGEDIRAHCKTLIAGYKCPGSVEFRESLPVSGAGKTLKHVLREPFWKGLDRRVG
jgi:long-chain acyl-CoA synthetase